MPLASMGWSRMSGLMAAAAQIAQGGITARKAEQMAMESRPVSQAIVDRFEDSEDVEVQKLVGHASLHVTGLTYRERMLRLFRLG